jgi:stress-induced morphogen
MALDKYTLESLIKTAFPDATVELTALVDDGDHYALTIESTVFTGKNRIAQHRMVYDALGGKMGGELHALQLKTVAKSG